MPAATTNQSAQRMGPDHSLITTTILLLVSDPLVRSVLQDTLEHEGYTVVTAGDLGSAVDRLTEVTPDLLITRTYVQNLPGHEAAKYLRERCKSMKVLLVGGLLADVVGRLLGVGADAVGRVGRGLAAGEEERDRCHAAKGRRAAGRLYGAR